MNVLDIPKITKNIVLVRQIVGQGMQVQFAHLMFFIEEEEKVIAQGLQEGRMFILGRNEVRTAILVKGQRVKSDVNLCHKRFGHVNFPQASRNADEEYHFRIAKI